MVTKWYKRLRNVTFGCIHFHKIFQGSNKNLRKNNVLSIIPNTQTTTKCLESLLNHAIIKSTVLYGLKSTRSLKLIYRWLQYHGYTIWSRVSYHKSHIWQKYKCKPMRTKFRNLINCTFVTLKIFQCGRLFPIAKTKTWSSF